MTDFKKGYALLIGIANYAKVRSLPQSVSKDARDFSILLQSPEYCGYAEDHIHLLADSQANANGIRAGFKWLSADCGPDDTALIFISSHGGRVEHGLQAGTYLLPYDSDPHQLKKSAISGDELSGLLHEIKSQRLLGFFDFCYSGGAGEAKGNSKAFPFSKNGFNQEDYDQLAHGKGRVIMASSRREEESFVFEDMGNSLFTHFLLEALRGKALSRGDGLMRVFDIFHYIADNVGMGGQQHPVFKAADLEDNFPVALFRGGEKSIAEYRPESLAVERLDNRALREMMIRYFSRSDLDLLCNDIQQDMAKDGINLRVSLELVGGNESLPKQALDLIMFFERRGFLSYLVQGVRKARPGVMCAI